MNAPPPSIAAEITTPDAPIQRSRRGFAAMDRSLQRTISSRGGLAAHRSGRAHRFSPAEAQEAGRKGGTVVSRDSEHMARIGSRGGRSRRSRALQQDAGVSPG